MTKNIDDMTPAEIAEVVIDDYPMDIVAMLKNVDEGICRDFGRGRQKSRVLGQR